MSEFIGMALYSQSDIKAALTNYKIGLDRAKVLLAKLIKEAEDNWQPSWWDKLRGVRKFNDKKYDKDYFNYIGYMNHKGLLDLDKPEWGNILPYLRMNFTGWRIWTNQLEPEFHQITNLYGSGRDCYLTPAQAKFVNKFKDMEVL